MKRLFVIMCSMMVISGAFATANICRKNNTVVILMSKSTNGTSRTYNETDKTWSVTFDYTTLSVGNRTLNTISGNAACNELTHTPDTADTSVMTTNSDTGQYCWCEMMLPAHSYWTYAYDFSTDSACAAGCAQKCADKVKDSQTFRTGMFSAIW